LTITEASALLHFEMPADGPAFPFVFIPHYFKYHTLRYRLIAKGFHAVGHPLSARGHLELTRIQDIHLSSNLIERWLGLAEDRDSDHTGSASADDDRGPHELRRCAISFTRKCEA
jgi:hypothetical protein